jgi:hypothetical protein
MPPTQEAPMRWIIKAWHRHLRRIDIKILWPAIRKQANDLISGLD